MTSDFLLFFSQLNLNFLFFVKNKKVIKKYSLLEIQTVEILKYKKNNNEY